MCWYFQNTSRYLSWLLGWKCNDFRSQKHSPPPPSSSEHEYKKMIFDSVKPCKLWILYQVGALSLVSEASDYRFIFYDEWMLVSCGLF